MAREEILSLKQKQFLDAYLANGENATKAALAVGYSSTSAAESGSELLKKSHVQIALERRRSDLAKTLEITPNRIVAELARIAMVDVATFFRADGSLKPFNELPEDLTRSIGGFEVDKGGKVNKVRLSDKLRALELIAKITGVVKPDTQQTNVQVVILPPKESAPTIDVAPALPKPEWE